MNRTNPLKFVEPPIDTGDIMGMITSDVC